jgi:hypothetical protein
VQVSSGPLIQPVAASDLKVVVPKADASAVTLVYDVPPAINGPVTSGETLGRVLAQDQGQAMTEVMAISPVAFAAPQTGQGDGYNASAPPSDNPNQENQ